MDHLVEIDPSALYVFDRGYTDYEKFDQYCETGTRFVTRLKRNACIREVEEERVVIPDSFVVRDAIVWLGQYPGYWMRSPLRLVEVNAVDGEIITILTNDLEMDAQEIGNLYRRRWQIELFFKWIKQHLVVKRLYGKSEWAVHNQIWLALITYCLLVLLSQRIRHKGRLMDVYKCVKHHWADVFAVFIHSLTKRDSRKSRGRRAYPVDKIFEQTLHQYEHGEVEHLDDLTYDPVN